MFILIYGADGTGKSVQCKSILESAECSEHWSFATKNRRLYADSGIVSHELLRFNPDSTINPYQTIDAFEERVNKTVKENTVRTIVIDEITLLRKWAQPVVIEEINKTRRGTTKPMLKKISENNYSAWEQVNKIVYGKLELLANWSELNDAVVIAITSIVDERTTRIDEDGELHSVTTGRTIVDAKENVRKLADIRIKLEKDGSKGKGYYSFWEKTQDWMQPGSGDVCKVDKTGVLTELMVRGVI
jgi:hypothetical protein